ncbi:DUF2459 domain-containing protein [Kingella potus]|nr:DUF2459 domain-containing protein [Kingella potus]UOP01875.1 DUF2459 domain-containing protein [Kingella potus]
MPPSRPPKAHTPCASPYRTNNTAAWQKTSPHISNGATYRTLPVSGAHYTPDDAFYEAEGRYHLFNTCNSWLNRRLAESGLRSVVWTPFAAPLLDAYRQP